MFLRKGTTAYRVSVQPSSAASIDDSDSADDRANGAYLWDRTGQLSMRGESRGSGMVRDRGVVSEGGVEVEGGWKGQECTAREDELTSDCAIDRRTNPHGTTYRSSSAHESDSNSHNHNPANDNTSDIPENDYIVIASDLDLLDPDPDPIELNYDLLETDYIPVLTVPRQAPAAPPFTARKAAGLTADFLTFAAQFLALEAVRDVGWVTGARATAGAVRRGPEVADLRGWLREGKDLLVGTRVGWRGRKRG